MKTYDFKSELLNSNQITARVANELCEDAFMKFSQTPSDRVDIIITDLEGNEHQVMFSPDQIKPIIVTIGGADGIDESGCLYGEDVPAGTDNGIEWSVNLFDYVEGAFDNKALALMVVRQRWREEEKNLSFKKELEASMEAQGLTAVAA